MGIEIEQQRSANVSGRITCGEICQKCAAIAHRQLHIATLYQSHFRESKAPGVDLDRIDRQLRNFSHKLSGESHERAGFDDSRGPASKNQRQEKLSALVLAIKGPSP